MKNLLFTILTLLMFATGASARDSLGGFSRFTEKRPLRILCDWNFPPYEYIDDNGSPAGFNVEVLERILTLLNIPHRFEMQETGTYMKMYARHDFDIAVDCKRPGQDKALHFGNVPLGFYNVCAISHHKSNQIVNLNDLNGKKIFTQHGDISEYILQHGVKSAKIDETYDIHLALRAVTMGKVDYLIWIKDPSKWFIHKYDIKGLYISELNVPMSEFYFVSTLPEITNVLDEHLAHMQQNGEIDYLHAKWFQHQTSKKDNSYIVLWGLAILSIFTFVLAGLNQMQRNKIKRAQKRSGDLFKLRVLALKMDKSNIIIINPDEIDTRNKTLDIRKVHPDDSEYVRKLHEIADGTRSSLKEVIRYNASSAAHPKWKYYSTTAIAEKKKNGKVSKIVMTWKDITENVLERKQYEEMSNKYMAIFDSALIGLSFYDKDGFLINSNEQMCRIFKVQNIKDHIGKYNVFESSVGRMLKDDDGNILPLYGTTHIIHENYGIDAYVELQIEPVRDFNGNAVYIITAAKDVTYERLLQISSIENANKYKKAEIRMKGYSDMLRNVLDMSKTRIWICDLDKQTIKYSKDMKEYGTVITFNEYMNTLSAEDKKKVRSLLSLEDKDKPKSLNLIQHIKKSIFDKDIWLTISGVPIYNKNGMITEYRGMMHDVTELMQTQEKLKVETENAERSEKMKSMFLANMSHEIRTPLNSIVGFSDLLEGLDRNERNEFLRIINNNCDMLLRLINDILELSEMDSNSQTIVPAEIDWAMNFKDICASLKQRVTNENVEFITDNPYTKLVICVDAGRLNQVITNFVTNAIKYTEQGHIKVGYDYREEGLYIYCEDTGAGIPEDKKDKIFERFVKLNDFIQGTGIGLSICKAIAQQCSGKIGVNSTIGKGSEFWIWIPCNYVEKE